MTPATPAGPPPATALCWGTVPNATFPELVEAAGSAGFDAITISPALHLEIVDDGGLTARRLLEAASLRVAVVDPLISPLPGLPDPATVAADLRRFIEPTVHDVLRLAEVTGAAAVNLAHFLGSPVPIAQLGDAVGRACEGAAAIDCAVTLEFIPDTGVPDLSTALAVLEAVDAPNLGVMLDSWHLARSGGTAAEVGAAGPGAITGVQLCDRRTPAEGEAYVPMAGRLLPGEGELPLTELVAAILSVAPGVTFGVEVFDAELAAAPPTETARRALAALRSVLPGS